MHIGHTIFYIHLSSIPGAQAFWDTLWYMFRKYHLSWDKWPLGAGQFLLGMEAMLAVLPCPGHMPELQLSPRSIFFHSPWTFPSGSSCPSVPLYMCVWVHKFLQLLFHVATPVWASSESQECQIRGEERQIVCFLEHPNFFHHFIRKHSRSVLLMKSTVLTPSTCLHKPSLSGRWRKVHR